MTAPFDHPDLQAIEIQLQHRLDRILAAEQEAARVVARRGSTLRDRLLDAEDTGLAATVRLRTGDQVSGRVATVAVDHIEVHHGRMTTLVPLAEVAMVTIG